MRKTSSRRRGFTLIELMVVVAIIAILAAILVPALQKAQARAVAMNCLTKAKAIAAAIRTYASNWDGWTNRNPDYYVKSFGYHVREENGVENVDVGTQMYVPGTTTVAGWGRSWAANSRSTTRRLYENKINDFRCPAHANPPVNSTRIHYSYIPSAAFAGQNIMALPQPASQIIAVKEFREKRHSTSSGKLANHLVYADMHGLLSDGRPVAGLALRVWETTNMNAYIRQRESNLTTPRFETIWSSSFEGNGGVWLSFLDGQSVSTVWSMTETLAWGGPATYVGHEGNFGDYNWTSMGVNKYSNGNIRDERANYYRFAFGRNVMCRFDGVLSVPVSGDDGWEIRHIAPWNNCKLWVGAEGNIDDPAPTNPAPKDQDPTNGVFKLTVTSTTQPFPIKLWYARSTNGSWTQMVDPNQTAWNGGFAVKWKNVAAGATPAPDNYTKNSEETIPAQFLKFIP